MDHIPVQSSNITSIGYDEPTGTLEVRFTNGGVYSYKDVPPVKFSALMGSPSIGKFLHEHIKGQHEHTKLENI